MVKTVLARYKDNGMVRTVLAGYKVKGMVRTVLAGYKDKGMVKKSADWVQRYDTRSAGWVQ